MGEKLPQKNSLEGVPESTTLFPYRYDSRLPMAAVTGTLVVSATAEIQDGGALDMGPARRRQGRGACKAGSWQAV